MPKEERVQPLHHCRQAIEQLEGGMRTVHKDMPGDGLFIPHKNEFADFGLLEARGIQVEEMLSREATLVSEIASMRAQLKLARQDAHAGRKKLDVPWLRRLNYAIIMRNKALAGLRVDRGLAQYQQKEERRRLTLLTQLSEQALFVRHAKRLLSKKVLEEIRAAVHSEVSVVVPLVPEHALDDCT
ncbi:hypothetical protein AL527_13270 [Pseudomonas fulva]|uniref:hypothetical protein n=2 Tax=Pseudomonas TaxID=286 RepID=UPI000CE997FC|nr:hypothetical protein [Pseudomonas fulva]AVF56050.1 hypothetical protein AL527_13270 [Pseudomonas fulva]